MIRLRGVRQNNLKRFDLDLPLHRLIVVTGLSGSGKSSLAFDTIFAEGQRRYIETFSPYARQFFDRMDKPQVDAIEGIPPAIAIEQRNAVKTTRSTVGTMTEICDYMKLLWPHVSQLHCRQCGQPVRKDPPQRIWETLLDREPAIRNTDLLIVFELPLTEKLSLTESLSLITRQGYQRLLLPAASARPAAALELNEAQVPWGGLESPGGERTATASELAGVRSGDRPDSKPLTKAPGRETEWEIVRIEEAADRLKELKPASLTVVQDRLKLAPAGRARFVEACEQAYHFGKGKLAVHIAQPRTAAASPARDAAPALEPSNSPTLSPIQAATLRFSNRYHCADCDIEYREPSPALFSFNHPLGACPTCRGFGRVIGIDYNLVLPDRSKTLAQGVVRPWQNGVSAECQDDLMKFCRIRHAPTDVPYERLPKKWRDWLIDGDPDYGKDAAHQWPRAWYGVKGYFRWLESKAYKMHVRVLLSRYRSYTPCPDCRGNRFQPESLLYTLPRDGTGPAPSRGSV
jgi:excinuclease ABC subunit A